MWIRVETMKKVLQKYWAWAFVVIPLLLQAIFFYVPMFQGAFTVLPTGQD